jgi:hypothetical protein
MPRVLAMLLLGVLAVLAFGAMNQSKNRSQDTFRPKRRFWPNENRDAAPSDAATLHLVDVADLAGVRDAFTSAPIDIDGEIFRCGTCLAFYQRASVDALTHSNHGRCIACGGSDLAPVSLARASD